MLKRSSLTAAAAFALTFLIALGASRTLARVGGPEHVLRADTIAGDVGVLLLIASLVVLAGVVYAMAGMLRRRRNPEDELVHEEQPVPWWEKLLVLALGLLPLAGLVAAIVVLAEHGRGATRPAAPAPVPGAPAVPTPSPHAAGPTVHWWLFAALAAVIFAAAALLFVWRRLRRVERLPRRVDGRAELRTVLEESLEELEREPDPRLAVIRAYSGMERTLARRGVGREPSEAPLEYLARLLRSLRVSGPAGERLTALFQTARFSQHAIGPAMKREAIGALAAVRDELTQERR